MESQLGHMLKITSYNQSKMDEKSMRDIAVPQPEPNYRLPVRLANVVKIQHHSWLEIWNYPLQGSGIAHYFHNRLALVKVWGLRFVDY